MRQHDEHLALFDTAKYCEMGGLAGPVAKVV